MCFFQVVLCIVQCLERPVHNTRELVMSLHLREQFLRDGKHPSCGPVAALAIGRRLWNGDEVKTLNIAKILRFFCVHFLSIEYVQVPSFQQLFTFVLALARWVWLGFCRCASLVLTHDFAAMLIVRA